MLPKISIVIPSYNKADYIRDTLDSIFKQEYPNLEVIIQDGGSTDGTVGVIKKFATKYPKIVSWVSKKDKGQMDAINKGLKKATGELLTFINADDIYEQGALEAIGKAYSENPDALWLAGRGKVINKEGKEVAGWVTKYKNLLLKLNSYNLLLVTNYLMQPSVFLTKNSYQKYGPFKGTDKFVMEYDLWLKLGKTEMPTVIDRNLSRFRLAGDNISSTQFSNTLTEDLKIVRNYTNNPILLGLHKLHNVGRIGIIRNLT
jgi:glycosyltransferase involved in cell wall biosynthesis